MTQINPNTLWAIIFVDELARSGLRAAVIAPGSRSTPLTVAFAQHPDIAVYSLLDERGAAFFALGMALMIETPVALICTSGTATANFHPAVIEAYQSHIPLLVLTTDRPHELRDSGANQTINQLNLYGNHIRWFVDVAPPETDPPAKTGRYLRTLANRAIATSLAPVAGPVHLNFPFRKPLEPTPVDNDVLAARPNNCPFTHISQGVVTPTSSQLDSLFEAIQQASRGLIVCGPRCPSGQFPAAVSQLAEAAGYPILADSLSGVRFGPHWAKDDALIFSGYESYLSSAAAKNWPSPELILQLGTTPTSKNLGDYLGQLTHTQRVLINDSGTWHDDTHTLTDLLRADPQLTCQALTARLEASEMTPRDETWLTTWQHAEGIAAQAFTAIRNTSLFEGTIVANVIKLMPAESILYVGNSLPVRHLEQFAQPRQADIKVLANRGASGIDGVVSSAFGAAAATDRPLVLVIGDVSFYHDLNGLLAWQRCGIKITIVLINNNGGGIFHRLPIANFDPPFTDLFVTPHGLNFGPVVEMFGGVFTSTHSQTNFSQAFHHALQANTLHVVEVKTDSVFTEQQRREMVQQVAELLDDA